MSSAQQHEMQELSILEHNLQALVVQFQTVELEMNEINTALAEVKGTKEDVYRVLSSVMVKSDKAKIVEELEKKKKVLEMRLQTIEKQQKLLESKSEQIRREIEKSQSSENRK